MAIRRQRGWVWFGLALVLIVFGGLALLRSTQKTSSPDGQPTPGGEAQNPQTLVSAGQGIAITADTPARIAAVWQESLDLGTTPTSLTVDQVGYWAITAYDQASSQQQVVVKKLEPGQPETIRFAFNDTRRWSAPLAHRPTVVKHPLAEAETLLGVNPRSGQLEALGPAGNPAQSAPIQTVVWYNQQNYLYLTSGGQLVLVQPGGGWEIKGVRSLAGNNSQAGWLTESSQVELLDWASGQQRRVGIVDTNADELFVGQQSIYLLGRDDSIRGPDEQLHPSGWIKAYNSGSGDLLGKIAVLGGPKAMTEIGGYSFWQIAGELYVLDDQLAGADRGWGFPGVVVDLISGTDHRGQPTIYILTEAGEVWGFNLERQTYSLVGRKPGSLYRPGWAAGETLVQADDQIYFGFYWGRGLEQTFRLQLSSL